MSLSLSFTFGVFNFFFIETSPSYIYIYIFFSNKSLSTIKIRKRNERNICMALFQLKQIKVSISEYRKKKTSFARHFNCQATYVKHAHEILYAIA